MTKSVTSRPTTPHLPESGHLPGGSATATTGPFYSDTVATHGAVAGEATSFVPHRLPSHPYSFPPNGKGQNAADRIANAMWEMGHEG